MTSGSSMTFSAELLESLIPLEEIQDSQHKLLDILHASRPSRIVLSINEAILEPARAIRATSCPTLKGVYKHYYKLAMGVEFWFSPPPPPNSLVVHCF